jgi:hypothetical protein
VDYFHAMQCYQTMNKVYECSPDLLFRNEFSSFFVIVNFRLQIAIFCKLHDYAKTLGTLFEKSFFIRNNIIVPSEVNKKNDYCMEAKILTSLSEFSFSLSVNFASFTYRTQINCIEYLFQSILLVIRNSPHFKHLWERAWSYSEINHGQ